MKRWTGFVLLAAIAAWILVSSVLAQQTPFQTFLTNVRNDIELLADRVYGARIRPEADENAQGWTGNSDVASQTIVADIWYDNEQLADAIFGVGQRPADWLGATSGNPELVARNVRHDLEIAANAFIGVDLRPDGWRGAALYHTCSRTILNILYLLNTFYNIQPTTSESVANYCGALRIEIEDQLAALTFNDEALAGIPGLVLAVRGDLERLADEKLGLNTRPEAWIGNKDVNSPLLADDNFSDLERLADTLLGSDQRPPGWRGALSSSPVITFRNLRYDLELLADATLGPGVRPRGWQGEDALLRCDTIIQNLVLVVQQNYEFTIDPTGSDNAQAFCASIELAANNLIENPPPPPVVDEVAEDNRYRGEAQYAFAYFDAAATQFYGIMPAGTEFRAWYRNFSGSSMMFVSGDNFAVYIDRRWTTMEQETFDTLPTLEGVRPLAFCDAVWCNGPGPTPTPTGGGPLFDIIFGVTPPATPGAGSGDGQTIVNWNHIRVTYVLQRPETRTAQVTLEICVEVQQISCEPVLSVFNNATGLPLPPVSQLNGQNVYELPYGYTDNLVITGSTLISYDVWLNDPSVAN